MRREAFLISSPMIAGALVMLWMTTVATTSINWFPALIAAIYTAGVVVLNVIAWREWR